MAGKKINSEMKPEIVVQRKGRILLILMHWTLLKSHMGQILQRDQIVEVEK